MIVLNEAGVACLNGASFGGMGKDQVRFSVYRFAGESDGGGEEDSEVFFGMICRKSRKPADS